MQNDRLLVYESDRSTIAMLLLMATVVSKTVAVLRNYRRGFKVVAIEVATIS